MLCMDREEVVDHLRYWGVEGSSSRFGRRHRHGTSHEEGASKFTVARSNGCGAPWEGTSMVNAVVR